MSNRIEETEEQKRYLQSVLYKAQFKQKLGLKYLLLSGFSISLLIIFYILDFDFLTCCWVYIAVMSIYAKWFFPYTKDKGHYQVFLIKMYCTLKRNILVRLREQR
jgi:hypothetical protein